MKETKLTPKQQAFADYYIESGNAADAYIKAGYKDFKSANVEGTKTLNKPNVRAYVDSKMNQLSNNRIASAEEVLELLTSIARGEETEEKIVFSQGESQVVELRAGIGDRNKALELLGKRYAIFTEKKELSGTLGVNIIDDLDDEDE